MKGALALLAPAGLAAQTSYVTAASGAGRLTLAAAGQAAPLYAAAEEWPGVVRAVKDLQADVAKVTSVAPPVSLGALPPGREIVLVGTLGRSPLVDSLVRTRRLDVTGVRDRWETYVSQIVEKPFPGVDRALVIAGSDRRGTIYGVYDLSAQIGVSPWTWWADVPVRHRASLFVLPGRRTQGEPAVKYRGIFINDEAPAFSGWAREQFGGVNHRVYERMFELILRMKGNYLWPAMWGNAFADDDSLSARLADEYGIVMGTRENVVTVGMRGDGDRPMTTNGESNIALLEHVVADQRAIIADVTGRPAAETPQMWALYKEVQDYYDKGMRVPDDVTLLFSDDNWGNIRRLPSATDRGRAGGFGIYYHFDYVGGPRNYKWLNTNPIARVWEQMHLAHEQGANRIWVVNVGDVKPMEMPIQFFLDYAWNPDAIPADRLPEWTRRWAAQQFGDGHAAEIADVVTTTLTYAGRRKPELLDTATYSLTNFREAERVVEDWNALRGRAESLSQALPADARDAFYELVLHPVLANANLHELYVTVAKNRPYAQQGRVTLEQRVDVSVDWSRVPPGTQRATVTFSGPDRQSVPIQIIASNPPGAARDAVVGHVQGNGVVSIEAEHYTRAVGSPTVEWTRIPDLGRTLSGMTPLPTTAPSVTPGGASPRLEYRFVTFDSGAVRVSAYLSPTHNFHGGLGLRYAVSIDDETPRIVDIHADSSSTARTDGNRAWEQSVADNVKLFVSAHTIARPGAHVLEFWMVDPAVVLQKLVVSATELPNSYLGPPESYYRPASTVGARP